MTRVLLDTGPLVAALDTRDSNHLACIEYLRTARDDLFTTEAVLTEAMHLLGAHEPRGLCFRFLRNLNVRFASVSGQGLLRAEALMKQYADLPMDYADASLVVAGEALGIDTVLTLAQRDFQVYRLEGRRPFRFVLR